MTEAVCWVSSSLEEVAVDREADGNEEPVPLVPLGEELAAMEQPQFLKLLTALDLVPPSNEQVRLWRTNFACRLEIFIHLFEKFKTGRCLFSPFCARFYFTCIIPAASCITIAYHRVKVQQTRPQYGV